MRKALMDLYSFLRRVLFGVGVVNRKGKGTVNLIDVGSVERLPEPWYERAYEIQNLLNFEPRDAPRKGRYVVTMNCGLWENNGEEDFYIYKGFGGTGSSLLEQNYEYVEENFEELKVRGPKYLADTWFERSELVRVERVNCRKLDDVLDELGEPFRYHFLKIDAQGG